MTDKYKAFGRQTMIAAAVSESLLNPPLPVKQPMWNPDISLGDIRPKGDPVRLPNSRPSCIGNYRTPAERRADREAGQDNIAKLDFNRFAHLMVKRSAGIGLATAQLSHYYGVDKILREAPEFVEHWLTTDHLAAKPPAPDFSSLEARVMALIPQDLPHVPRATVFGSIPKGPTTGRMFSSIPEPQFLRAGV